MPAANAPGRSRPSGLISDDDALDLTPGLTGFIAPTMQELNSAASSASSRLRAGARRPGQPLQRATSLGSSRTEPAGQARDDFRERPARDGPLHCARCRRRGGTLVARYAGLAGSPDESGKRRRERGVARAGNTRVRCGMIQLAWRFLRFQKDSALCPIVSSPHGRWARQHPQDGGDRDRHQRPSRIGGRFGGGLGLAAAAGVFAPFMLGSITPAMGAEVP